MAWTVANMQAKIKDLCGNSALVDAEILVRINNVYQNVLPLEFHLQGLEGRYTLTCIDGIAQYTIDPDLYFSVSSPAYIDNLGIGSLTQIRFRTDPIGFWSSFPEPTALGTAIKAEPSQVLYWMQTIFPRPVPDAAHVITLDSYDKPTALVAGAPLEDLWGPVLCYDVATDILFDAQDTDPIQGLMEARTFFADKIVSKEIMQLENTRAGGSF